MRIKTCVGLLLPVVMTCTGADIVRNGKPCADIVIAENAGAETLSAAESLREHLRLISGATLKIVPPAKAKASTLVCVGESSCTRKAGYRMPKFNSSGYDIWVKGNCIVLAGPVFAPAGRGTSLEQGIHPHSAVKIPVSPSPAGDNGVMHAVSAFLEHLGVRFYAPGKEGTILPRLSDIRVGDFRETRTAAFARREYRGVADPETKMWFLHLKCGSSVQRTGVLPVAEVARAWGKRHPDRIARSKTGDVLLTDDGCPFPKFADPDLIRACAARAGEIFDADPGLGKLVITLPSLRGDADASELAAVRRPGVYPQDDFANLTAAFAEKIAEAVEKKHPGKKILWQGLPRKALPEPADFPTALSAVPAATAAADYTSVKSRTNYATRLKKLADVFKAKEMEQREWWDEYASPDTVRQGWFFMHALQEVRKLQKPLLAGFLMDAGSDPATGKLAEAPLTCFMHYLNSKLLWDPDLDVDALTDEYCRLWFGPAAGEMKSFMTLWENISNRPMTRSISRMTGQLTPDDIPMQFELLDKAEKAAPEGSVFRRRVRAVRKSLAGLDGIFEKRTPAGKELRGSILPLTAECDGKPEKYAQWVSLSPAGATETRAAVAFTEDRRRMFVFLRCGEPEMKKLKTKKSKDDSPEVLSGDRVRIDFITNEKGVYTLCADVTGAFWDGCSDADELGQSGCSSGWDQEKSRVVVKRFPDRWEMEISVDVLRCGKSPGFYPPWGLNITRTRTVSGREETFSLARNAAGEPRKWRRLTLPMTDASGRPMERNNTVPVLLRGCVPESVYTVRRASEKVDLAAPWNGACWKNVPEMRLAWENISFGRSSGFRPDARAKIQYDDDFIYVLYQVKDCCVRGDFKHDQDMVCLDSCMEFFVKPDPAGPYYNFECNCIGTLLLYEIQVNGENKIMSPMPLDELKKVGRFSTLPRDMKGELPGPVTWRMGLKIPVEMFVRRTGIPAKLKGQVWGANVYKCADWTSLPCWLSWKKNWTFHNPEGFGRLIFE